MFGILGVWYLLLHLVLRVVSALKAIVKVIDVSVLYYISI